MLTSMVGAELKTVKGSRLKLSHTETIKLKSEFNEKLLSVKNLI
jgi:hypothetical protein